MNKINYILIILITLPMFIMVSCDDNKSDDTENPQVLSIIFNMNDTIVVGKNDTIRLNDSLKDHSLADTILIGRKLTISGRFSDNEGLSTVFVRLFGDTLLQAQTDTCYRLKKSVSNIGFFRKTEAWVRHIVLEPNSISGVINKGGKDYPVRTGAEYRYNISCVDIAGNQDSTSYRDRPIVLLTLDELIAARKKKMR